MNKDVKSNKRKGRRVLGGGEAGNRQSQVVFQSHRVGQSDDSGGNTGD